MAYDPKILSMHRSQERRAQRFEDAVNASLLRKNTREICQQVRDLLPQEQYDAWWAATPDGDEEFYKAAVRKLAELRSAARVPETSSRSIS